MKKFSIFLIVVLTGLLLVACGGSEDNSAAMAELESQISTLQAELDEAKSMADDAMAERDAAQAAADDAMAAEPEAMPAGGDTLGTVQDRGVLLCGTGAGARLSRQRSAGVSARHRSDRRRSGVGRCAQTRGSRYVYTGWFDASDCWCAI